MENCVWNPCAYFFAKIVRGFKCVYCNSLDETAKTRARVPAMPTMRITCWLNCSTVHSVQDYGRITWKTHLALESLEVFRVIVDCSVVYTSGFSSNVCADFLGVL